MPLSPIMRWAAAGFRDRGIWYFLKTGTNFNEVKMCLTRQGAASATMQGSLCRQASPTGCVWPSVDGSVIFPPQAEESAAHTDLAAHDKATLAAANAIFGRQAASFEELPLLPTAPWNRKPGYLVSGRSP